MGLTVTNISHRTGAAPSTVRWWIRQGLLSAEITPMGYRITEAELERFLADNKKWLRPKRWAVQTVQPTRKR